MTCGRCPVRSRVHNPMLTTWSVSGAEVLRVLEYSLCHTVPVCRPSRRLDYVSSVRVRDPLHPDTTLDLLPYLKRYTSFSTTPLEKDHPSTSEMSPGRYALNFQETRRPWIAPSLPPSSLLRPLQSTSGQCPEDI